MPRLPVHKPTDPLDSRERLFVAEMLTSFSVSAAAQRLGCGLARVYKMLHDPRIIRAMDSERKARIRRLRFDTDDLVNHCVALVTHDAREFSEHQMTCCRYCWGEDHLYQFNDVELRAARTSHLATMMGLPENQRVPFDESGGGGYNRNRDPMRGQDWVDRIRQQARFQSLPEPMFEPNSDHSCPNCYGDGEPHVVFKDSRYYSPAAAAAYKGVKISANGGIEIQTRETGGAMILLAKHLNVDVPKEPDDRVEVKEIRRVIVDVDHEDINDAPTDDQPAPDGEAGHLDTSEIRTVTTV